MHSFICMNILDNQILDNDNEVSQQQLQHLGEQPPPSALIGRRGARGRVQNVILHSYWLKTVSVVTDVSGYARNVNSMKITTNFRNNLKKRAPLLPLVCAGE